MLSLIVALFLLGLVLISFEIVIPGGILGLLGALAIMASWAVAFSAYGVDGGLIAVLAGLSIVGLALIVELKILPRTKLGRKLFLERSIDSTSHRSPAAPDIVGKEGEALTTLAPTGVVVVEDAKYEALSISGFIERGTRLQVVDFDNFRIRVRKI